MLSRSRAVFIAAYRTRVSFAVGAKPFSFASVRHFGIIGDAVNKIASNKMDGEKEKRFASMMEAMLSGEKWSLRPWKKTIDDQLGSWIMYVPGMKDSTETKQLNEFKDLLAAFSDEDLDNPTEIDFKGKERISRNSGKGVDDVSKLLVNYKQSLIVQQWLTLKKSLGERIPTNELEMRQMQETDARLTGIAQKILRGKKKGGRGRGSPF